MKFKNHADYQEQRNALLVQAQEALDNGEQETFNTCYQDVTDLDAAYEQYAAAQANLAALSGSAKPQATIASLTNPASLENDSDPGLEYRRAFMNYALKGEPIPAKLKNVDTTTKTTDIGEMIPETVLQRIIEKMESTGMILPLVTRTSYKGGITIPTSSAKPTATWVAEGVGSDKQKKTTGGITFNYHKLRCAVAVTLETDVMALSVFETTLINNVTEAMVKALEQAIVSGDGSGKPKGILAETAPSGQNIDLAKAAKVSYDTLINAEAALPLAYESRAVWFMSKQTFMAFAGMVDTNGQPIARTNYGINGKPERVLLGRRVICNDYMTGINATLTADTVVAFLFDPADYILNTNLNMTIKRYEDNDTDDQVTKAVMLADGKVVDKNSLVTVTKKIA